jgi:hypothetical protein
MAAHQRGDAGHELADAERFRQVVVGAALESEHFVGFAITRGEHQDRRVDVPSAAANGAAHAHSIESGQHDIEQHEIEGRRASANERLPAVADFIDRGPGEVEVQVQQLTNAGYLGAGTDRSSHDG